MTSQNLDEIYKKISSVVPEIEWRFHAPIIDKINKLKKEKTQSYLLITIKLRNLSWGCGYSGRFFGTCLEAEKTDAKIIVLCRSTLWLRLQN